MPRGDFTPRTGGRGYAPTPKKKIDDRYQRWLEQKAAYERQKAAAEADYRRRQREAQQAAQRRRNQVEQQARIAEQRRREAIERQRNAAQQRSDAMRARRLARHTVKKGETAESIAGKYGASAREVAGAVPGSLRPGQRIQVPDYTHEEARMGMAPRGGVAGGGGAVVPGIINTLPMGRQILKWGTALTPTIQRALGRFIQHAAPADQAELDRNRQLFNWDDTTPYPGRVDYGDYGQALYEEANALEQSRQFNLLMGNEIPRADLAEYNEQRRIPGGIHDQIAAEQDQARFEKANFASMMRYTGQGIAYAYEAMISGDPNWMDYITAQNIKDEYGNDLTGIVTMTITDGRWEQGPMREQFSDEMWEKVEALGFVETAPGFWEVPMLEPPDFGMGGFSFPGFDSGLGFGGGGGGDYEYLSRGGQMRRKSGGGSSTGQTYRVFPEGVPPAHWRI
jgi:hypothetical protein